MPCGKAQIKQLDLHKRDIEGCFKNKSTMKLVDIDKLSSQNVHKLQVSVTSWFLGRLICLFRALFLNVPLIFQNCGDAYLQFMNIL